MKAQNLLNYGKHLYRNAILPLLVVFVVLGLSMNASAQKYELTGTTSQITQTTEITLSNSILDKFYYLFRIDDAGEYHSVTFMVGQNLPLEYAPQTKPGKYVVYEFDEFKELPFDLEKFNPKDGILQDGEVHITTENN